MRLLVHLPAFRRNSDVEAATVRWMINSLNESALLELVADASHRTESHAQSGSDLPHRAWPLKIQAPQHIRLRDRQTPVERIVDASKLVQFCQVIQPFVQ